MSDKKQFQVELRVNTDLSEEERLQNLLEIIEDILLAGGRAGELEKKNRPSNRNRAELSLSDPSELADAQG